MQQFNNCEKNLTILHVIINKYIVDNKVYNSFPDCKKFKKIILELEFVCLNKNLINKVKNLFNECKIDIKKRKDVFLFFKLILNLKFFTITNTIKKNGVSTNNCFTIKFIGFVK